MLRLFMMLLLMSTCINLVCSQLFNLFGLTVTKNKIPSADKFEKYVDKYSGVHFDRHRYEPPPRYESPRQDKIIVVGTGRNERCYWPQSGFSSYDHFDKRNDEQEQLSADVW